MTSTLETKKRKKAVRAVTTKKAQTKKKISNEELSDFGASLLFGMMVGAFIAESSSPAGMKRFKERLKNIAYPPAKTARKKKS